jgi:drug/metabolite transporter (DMT)-like permease
MYMSKKQLYKVLSTVAGLVGIGMILGQSLSNGTTNTAGWVGGILILAAAVLFGMYISLEQQHPKKVEEKTKE